jgi:Fe-S oxidoreductase
MHYQGPVYRPPSEAESILLQITTGCSHNKCSFCGMYKQQRFSIIPEETVYADIDYAVRHFSHARRLFLCDGDALILPQKRLVPILARIQEKLPQIKRVGIYANCKSIKTKTVAELSELRRLGLGIVYMGLESGDDHTLTAINKGASGEDMVAMAAKVKEAGIMLSVTVMLGIAGPERSALHAEETGRVLSAMDPEYVGALSLMIEPRTKVHADIQAGRFVVPDPLAILRELRAILAATCLTNGLFHANHASNYLSVRAKLPDEKETTLALIDQALAGNLSLRPEFLRAL